MWYFLFISAFNLCVIVSSCWVTIIFIIFFEENKNNSLSFFLTLLTLTIKINELTGAAEQKLRRTAERMKVWSFMVSKWRARPNSWAKIETISEFFMRYDESDLRLRLEASVWDGDESCEKVAQVWFINHLSASYLTRRGAMWWRCHPHTHDFTLTLTHSHQTSVLLSVLLMTVSFRSHDVRCFFLTPRLRHALVWTESKSQSISGRSLVLP